MDFDKRNVVVGIRDAERTESGTAVQRRQLPGLINPATAGLRNLTCRLNSDGTVTVYALTSTVSTNGDLGADPNKLVAINDVLANTSPAVGASEQFTTIETAAYGQVLRGVRSRRSRLLWGRSVSIMV